MSDALRKLVREILTDELEEMTTSAAAGAYQTPNAFKSVDDEDENPLVAEGRYHGFKNDDSATDVQKIGRTISEITRQLNEMHRVVRMASRLKTETCIPQEKLWKRTAKHVEKMEAKMEAIKECIQELRK